MTALGIIGACLVIAGALIFATAALGVLRFRDVFARVSAVGTAGGIGISCVIVGALLINPSLADSLKVIAIVLLQLATSAIGTIVLARSALLSGSTVVDVTFNNLDKEV